MKLDMDTGSIVVIIAVLVFYLRMILLQRQRAKRIRYERQVYAASAAKARKKGKAPPPPAAPDYSILSRHPRDRVIGIAGVVLILVGVFLYSALNPWQEAAAYWWVPLSAGIMFFSWLFQPGAGRASA